MSGKSTGFIIILLIVAGIGSFFVGKEFVGDFRTIDLPRGRSVIVLRNVQDVFPVFASSAKAELDLGLKQKQEVMNTTAGGKYESTVTKLYDDLDAINNDLRVSVVAAYVGLLARISAISDATSAAEAFGQWDRVLKLAIEQAFRVRAINKQIAAATAQTSGAKWDAIVDLGSEALVLAKKLKAAAETSGIE